MSRALFDRFPFLADRVPWIPLATVPTPVEALPSPESFAGRLFVKRDDLTSPLYGGNKVRKFEYLFALAQRRGARTLVTVGGIGSNQGLAAALHGRALGFAVDLALAWQPVTAHVRRNLRGMLAAGARLQYADTSIGAAWQAIGVRLARQRSGAAPFSVPVGATTALSSLGYVGAALELADQIRRGLLPEPQRIFVAAGTCGTAAGLVVGCRLAELRSRVTAVRIAPRAFTNRARLMWEARRVAAVLHGLDRRVPRIRVGWHDVTVVNGYAGSRYGAPTAEALAAIAWAGPGLSLESTYTGKALAACLDAARGPGPAETMLFWNTCNSAPFALADRLDGLPPALAARLAETAVPR